MEEENKHKIKTKIAKGRKRGKRRDMVKKRKGKRERKRDVRPKRSRKTRSLTIAFEPSLAGKPGFDPVAGGGTVRAAA